MFIVAKCNFESCLKQAQQHNSSENQKKPLEQEPPELRPAAGAKSFAKAEKALGYARLVVVVSKNAFVKEYRKK